MANYLRDYQRRDGVKLRKRSWENTWEGKAYKILQGMRTSTQRKGLGPIEWTAAEILEAIRDQKCCKTGILFVLSKEGIPAHLRTPFAPSPDRLDNSRGYTKDNVQWVCWMYNQLKGQADEETVELFLLSWIEHKQLQGTHL